MFGRKALSKQDLIYSSIFALVSMLALSVGRAIFTTGSLYGLLSHLLRNFAFALLYFVISFVFYALASWGMDRLSANQADGYRKHARIVIFASISAAWLITLFMHLPGTITFDIYYQIIQTDGIGPFMSHHPPVTTLFFGLFWAIGDLVGSRNIGLFLYSTTMIVITAASFTYGFSYLMKKRINRAFLTALIAFVAICPLFPLSAISMTKDYVFGAFWIVYLVDFMRFVDKDNLKTQDYVRIIITSLLLTSIKKTGVYILLLSAVILLIVKRKSALKFCSTTLAAAVLYFILIEGVLFSALHVEKTAANDLFSFPAQQIARLYIYQPHDISDKDTQIIDKVLPTDGLTARYNPTLSDPVKNSIRPEAKLADYARFILTWAKLGVTYPITYFDATANNTLSLFYPADNAMPFENIPAYWAHDPYLFNALWTEAVYPDREPAELQRSFDSVHDIAWVAPLREAYHQVVEAILAVPVLRLILMQCTYTFFIPLACFLYLLSKKKYEQLLVLVPIAISILVLIASPVTQSRYMVPLLYSDVFLIGYLATLMSTKSGDKNKVAEH